MEENEAEYIKNNITEDKKPFYLEKLEKEYLSKKYIDSLKYATSITYSNHLILSYKNNEILTKRHYFYKDGFFEKQLYKFKETPFASLEILNPDDFNKDPLTLLDRATLDYSLSGSNHIAIGIDFEYLYYYELILNNKKLQFKSPHEVLNIVN